MKNRHDYIPTHKGKCKRKKKLSPITNHRLAQLAETKRRVSSQDLQMCLERYYGVDVFASSVRRKLIQAGLPSRCPHRKAKITAVMAKMRFMWAHNAKKQFGNDWSKVD